MFGLRASAKRLRDRIANARSDGGAPAISSTESAAMMAHAIYHRENAGRETSLRQLHLIVDLSQPEALRVVQSLESSGMVEVARDLNDALESRVGLTPRMRKRLEQVLPRDAA